MSTDAQDSMSAAPQERERTEFEAWYAESGLAVAGVGTVDPLYNRMIARAAWDAQQERIDALTRDLALDGEQLRYWWETQHSCPCGARPESPATHPHVLACPTARALAREEGAT